MYVHFFAENYVYVHFSIREFENPSINEPMCMCTFQKAIYTLIVGGPEVSLFDLGGERVANGVSRGWLGITESCV